MNEDIRNIINMINDSTDILAERIDSTDQITDALLCIIIDNMGRLETVLTANSNGGEVCA